MLNLRVSSKKQAKIKLALQGCAGSGKTYSALLLAYGLTNDWTKIAIIDSENGSADLYAHLGNYNVLPLQDNFTPETYIEAIKICEEAKIEVRKFHSLIMLMHLRVVVISVELIYSTSQYQILKSVL